jgi:hypothetical protein
MGLLAVLPVLWITRQNLGFALWLSCCSTATVSAINPHPFNIFLALALASIALPTLWLAYRSRLQLPPLPWNWDVRQLAAIPWRHLGQLAASTLVASLLLALCLRALPKPQLPNLSALAVRPAVNELADRARDFEAAYRDAERPRFPDPPATASARTAEQYLAGSDFARRIEAKYQQLSPELQAELQAQTQAIVRYQRRLSGQRSGATAADRAQALAQFIAAHAQPSTAPPVASLPDDLIDSLLTSCPQPHSCQIPVANGQLGELHGLMARSIDMPPPLGEQQLAKNLDPGQLEWLNGTQDSHHDAASANTPDRSPPPVHQLNLLGIAVVLVVGMAMGCCWLWLRHEQKLRAQRRRFASLPPIEQVYRQMQKQLQRHGLASKRATQSPLEYAGVIHGKLPPTSGRIVDRISHTYSAWRYGRQPANAELLQKLLQELVTDLSPKRPIK